MKVTVLLALILLSVHGHSEVFSCSKYSPADFTRALAVQKRKFEADIKKWSDEKDKRIKTETQNKPEEESQKIKLNIDRDIAEQIHNSMRDSDSSLMNLLLWPELLEGKLFYYRVFQACAKAASSYVNTLASTGSNASQLQSWKDCMSVLYRLEKPAPAIELEKCFAKFERK